MELAGFGAWVPRRDLAHEWDLAPRLETLGFRAIWVTGGNGPEVFEVVERVLGLTEHVVVATAIANIRARGAPWLADWHERVTTRHPDRLLLGLGVGHPSRSAGHEPATAGTPLDAMRACLDGLDAARPPVPRQARVLAALGPRMTALGRDRAAGVHPYLTMPTHTAWARDRVGDALLAPEQTVVLDADPNRARDRARQFLRPYLTLPNYLRSLARQGFDEEDVAGAGSDRLVDALVAWGRLDRIAEQVRRHLDAGADHVGIQVVPAGGRPLANAWEEVSGALGLRD